MKKNSIVSVLLLSVATFNAHAMKATAKVSMGYDSNPFVLADVNGPSGGLFLDANLKARHYIDDFRIRGAFSRRTYKDSIDSGNYFIAKIDTKYKRKYNLFDKKAYSHLMLNYGLKDKTYVARSTGKIGSFSGQSIADRYDYDTWGVEAKTAVSSNESLMIGLKLNYLDKNYESYSISGLSNLDYDQLSLANDWTYDYGSNGKLKLNFYIASRDFDNKREKSLLGAGIAGTNLGYDIQVVSSAYDYKLSPEVSSVLTYRYEKRRDSGPGYYDTDEHRLIAKFLYDPPTKGLDFTASVTYRDREYVNSTVFIENEDGEPSKNGYTLKFNTNKVLDPKYGLPAVVFADIRFDDFSSSDPNYEYDRIQVYVGIKVRLDKL